MGDTDALRDKIAQAIHTETCLADTASCAGASDHDYEIADAVLPVVTQEAAQALSLLRSRVEALADQLDEAVQTIPTFDAASLGRRGGLRDAARLVRSLSDNKEQRQ